MEIYVTVSWFIFYVLRIHIIDDNKKFFEEFNKVLKNSIDLDDFVKFLLDYELITYTAYDNFMEDFYKNKLNVLDFRQYIKKIENFNDKDTNLIFYLFISKFIAFNFGQLIKNALFKKFYFSKIDKSFDLVAWEYQYTFVQSKDFYERRKLNSMFGREVVLFDVNVNNLPYWLYSYKLCIENFDEDEKYERTTRGILLTQTKKYEIDETISKIEALSDNPELIDLLRQNLGIY